MKRISLPKATTRSWPDSVSLATVDRNFTTIQTVLESSVGPAEDLFRRLIFPYVESQSIQKDSGTSKVTGDSSATVRIVGRDRH